MMLTQKKMDEPAAWEWVRAHGDALTRDQDGKLVSFTAWVTGVEEGLKSAGWPYGVPMQMAGVYIDALHAELMRLRR